jgi:hypothetical protein
MKFKELVKRFIGLFIGTIIILSNGNKLNVARYPHKFIGGKL